MSKPKLFINEDTGVAFWSEDALIDNMFLESVEDGGVIPLFSPISVKTEDPETDYVLVVMADNVRHRFGSMEEAEEFADRAESEFDERFFYEQAKSSLMVDEQYRTEIEEGKTDTSIIRYVKEINSAYGVKGGYETMVEKARKTVREYEEKHKIHSFDGPSL